MNLAARLGNVSKLVVCDECPIIGGHGVVVAILRNAVSGRPVLDQEYIQRVEAGSLAIVCLEPLPPIGSSRANAAAHLPHPA
jgi:hypothetical protein